MGTCYIAPIKNQLNGAFPLAYYLSPIVQVCLHLLWAHLYSTFIQVQVKALFPFSSSVKGLKHKNSPVLDSLVHGLCHDTWLFLVNFIHF